ncbi:MAG: hypothetical protein PVF83_10245 [Anaerolineales bacterium]|jgi:Tol biopolymer transport system component
MKKPHETHILLLLLAAVICGCQSGPNVGNAAPPDLIQPENNGRSGFIYLARGRWDYRVVDTAHNETISFSSPYSQMQGESLSPLGDKVAFWVDGHVHIYTVSTGEISEVGSEQYGSSQDGQLIWLNDSTQIATDCFPSDYSHLSEVCLFDIVSGEMQVLTELIEFTTTFGAATAVGGWSEQTNEIAFTLRIPPQASGHFQGLVFVVNLSTQETRLLFDERDYEAYTRVAVPRISKDGSKILVPAYVNNHNYEILLIDAQTGATSQITHSKENQSVRLPFWLDDEIFTATLINTDKDGYTTSHPIYSLSGEILDYLDFDEDYYLLSIFTVK